MKQKLIYQGAEAKIFKTKEVDPIKRFVEPKKATSKDWKILKKRVSKGYRLKELDDKIRKQRTKRETKLLEKASKIINVPITIERDPTHYNTRFEILMDYIEGKKLSEHLDTLPKKQATETCKQIGESLAKIHDNNIIHGDLTTSNLILDKENKVWFIDFGLGFHSERIEDKAVDLHLIKQALEAKHFKNWEEHYKNILQGYKSSENYKKTLEQLTKVESRGRYKAKSTNT